MVRIIALIISVIMAIIAFVGYCITGVNVMQAVFGVGGSYSAAFAWFITSSVLSIVSKLIVAFCKFDD